MDDPHEGASNNNAPPAIALPPPVAVAANQRPDEPCVECVRFLGALQQHVSVAHADSPIAIQKAAVKAWFECHYSLGDTGDSVVPVAVSRKTLLTEMNAFLAFMQWPVWKTQSAMYKDWFLREVMGAMMTFERDAIGRCITVMVLHQVVTETMHEANNSDLTPW